MIRPTRTTDRARAAQLGRAQAGRRDASHTSRGRTYRWQSHQRFLARRCLRNTASQRMPYFLEHPDGGAIVDRSDGGDDALRAQIEECRIQQRERDLRGEALAPVGRAQHVAEIGHIAFDQRQIAGADDPSGGALLHRELESGSRHFALRGEQAVQVLGRAVLVARTEEQIASHARVGRVSVYGAEVAAHEFAQVEPSRADREIELAHGSIQRVSRLMPTPCPDSRCLSGPAHASRRASPRAPPDRPVPPTPVPSAGRCRARR